MAQKYKKRAASLALSAVMAAGILAPAAQAAYVAPTSGVTANENILSAAAFAASVVSPEILGVNVVATNSAGIWGSSSEVGQNNMLGIFGSNVNENPDPYLYNFFYNYSRYGGGEQADEASDTSMFNNLYNTWTATPYTLNVDVKNGPYGIDTNTSVTISIAGVTKTLNYAFFWEPDILVSGGTDYESAYAEVIKAYQDTYNADYNPYIVCYEANNSTDALEGGQGLEYLIFNMAENLIDMSKVYEDAMDKTGKTTRYAQGPYEIATDYDKYVRGIYYYVQQQLASGALTEQVAVVTPEYDADLDMWKISQQTGRTAQYTAAVSQDLWQGLENGTIAIDGVAAQSGTSSATGSDVQGTASTNVYYLTTDQLIANCDVVVNAGQSASESAQNALAEAVERNEIRVLSELPSCVYGMTMQTHENGMGIPFFASYMYYDQDSTLNPADMIAYFTENFYHVTDNSALQNAISEMLKTASLPAGVSADLTNYSSEKVEKLILSGISYYEDTVKSTVGGTALAWDTLDMSVGIGSDNRNTNTSKEDSILGELPADEPTAITTTPTTGFTDVLAGSWYETAVSYVVENGLFNGTGTNTFSPEDKMDRGMFATVLHRLAGTPAATASNPFADVAAGTWYTDGVIWAAEQGIVTGTTATTFAPTSLLTREQIAAMLYRYANETATDADKTALAAFGDASSVSSYATDAMAWAVARGIITGKSGLLAPADTASRAEVAVMLMRFSSATA
ncbi:MAG: S-layer homology domain-containing protein [Oscillospiraceae bacterium]|nr:S-layer homology domain-containing protein [Oscillospiraceae bacterium]